eukprot:7378421-Prymnesium_polylepis.2
MGGESTRTRLGAAVGDAHVPHSRSAASRRACMLALRAAFAFLMIPIPTTGTRTAAVGVPLAPRPM